MKSECHNRIFWKVLAVSPPRAFHFNLPALFECHRPLASVWTITLGFLELFFSLRYTGVGGGGVLEAIAKQNSPGANFAFPFKEWQKGRNSSRRAKCSQETSRFLTYFHNSMDSCIYMDSMCLLELFKVSGSPESQPCHITPAGKDFFFIIPKSTTAQRKWLTVGKDILNRLCGEAGGGKGKPACLCYNWLIQRWTLRKSQS